MDNSTNDILLMLQYASMPVKTPYLSLHSNNLYLLEQHAGAFLKIKLVGIKGKILKGMYQTFS